MLCQTKQPLKFCLTFYRSLYTLLSPNHKMVGIKTSNSYLQWTNVLLFTVAFLCNVVFFLNLLNGYFAKNSENKFYIFGHNQSAFHHHWLFLDVYMKKWPSLCEDAAYSISRTSPTVAQLTHQYNCYNLRGEKVANFFFFFHSVQCFSDFSFASEYTSYLPMRRTNSRD